MSLTQLPTLNYLRVLSMLYLTYESIKTQIQNIMRARNMHQMKALVI
jgi:hypothetical protein